MIAVDSAILIDLLAAPDERQAQAAAMAVRDALDMGPVVYCDVVLAEVCTSLKNGADVLPLLDEAGLSFSPIDARSALRAGEMQRRHRQRGGGDARSAPDFLVGAHALMQCNGLISRDTLFLRDYFKGLKVIVPSE